MGRACRAEGLWAVSPCSLGRGWAVTAKRGRVQPRLAECVTVEVWFTDHGIRDQKSRHVFFYKVCAG